MRYFIAVLAIACLASASQACGGKLFNRIAERRDTRIESRRPVAKVLTAPVKAVRTIVCNGKTCVVK